jgi:hypothetical protein
MEPLLVQLALLGLLGRLVLPLALQRLLKALLVQLIVLLVLS